MGMNAQDGEPKEGAVKYHLVEAEEVNAKPQPQQMQHQQKNKRKGKLNWSQFELEEGEEVPLRTTKVDTSTREKTQQQKERGRSSRGGRFGGRRVNGDSNGTFYNGVYVPTPDVKVTAQWAKTQIEFYFTNENLVHDIFLRQHMDVDGFVPLAFVGSFQAVYSVHQDYESLLEAMKQSETMELDEQNEKIRLRNGCQKWVWPNADGGYGVPRYVKLAEGEAPAEQ